MKSYGCNVALNHRRIGGLLNRLFRCRSKNTSSASLAFVRGIHQGPVNSPHKGQWRGTLMFSLICARINSWVKNREAGDLRRHRAHYDVIVMLNDKISFTGRRHLSIDKGNLYLRAYLALEYLQLSWRCGLLITCQEFTGVIWLPQYIPWADFRLAPNQWETTLLCNDVSHWLGASLESALHTTQWYITDSDEILCINTKAVQLV